MNYFKSQIQNPKSQINLNLQIQMTAPHPHPLPSGERVGVRGFEVSNFDHSCLPRPRPIDSAGPGPVGRVIYLLFGAWDLVLFLTMRKT